jgi:hypothetical protein
MPITRSEVIYLAAGVAVGAVARSTFPNLKDKIGPVVAGAGAVLAGAYTEVARRVAEKVESVQDSMAEQQPSSASGGEASAA